MNRQIDRVIAQINTIILGKEPQIKLALACLLARGHLLIEDIPGVGKTTLAHVLAASLGLKYNRIQFTSDLLPADILGTAVYEKAAGEFRFHPGPIFAQLILADEINRATPKSQSALLEAMEEFQVTIEGETRPLPEPFFVIATQNPAYQIGTFPLPESQLDRFLLRLELGYPDPQAERELLAGLSRRELMKEIKPLMSIGELRALQAEVDAVHIAGPLLDYVQALLSASRQGPYYRTGLSPRAGLSLAHAARAWALLQQRDFVIPEDVQYVLPYVAGHRLQASGEGNGVTRADLIAPLLEVPIP